MVCTLIVHCPVCDVGHLDMIEFEGDAPYDPTYIKSRGFIESLARENLPDNVTEEFEDDIPGAPYSTQTEAHLCYTPDL